MSMTRRGIFHDLSKSIYSISNNEIELYFSSKFYMEKFVNEYKNEREVFHKKVERLIKDTPFNYNLLSDIYLYKNIEKRGFRVEFKGGNITWENLHLYALVKQTSKNIEDWQETQNLK